MTVLDQPPAEPVSPFYRRKGIDPKSEDRLPKEDDPSGAVISARTLAHCQNLAAFIWSSFQYSGYSKAEFWDALPRETQVLIEDFVLAPKQGPTLDLRRHEGWSAFEEQLA